MYQTSYLISLWVSINMCNINVNVINFHRSVTRAQYLNVELEMARKKSFPNCGSKARAQLTSAD